MEGGSKIDRPDLNVEKEEVTNGAEYTSPVDKRSGESDPNSKNNHIDVEVVSGEDHAGRPAVSPRDLAGG